ncbi:MAG: hypothetical protein ACT4PZ_07335 [Panacagrimonas sp.]
MPVVSRGDGREFHDHTRVHVEAAGQRRIELATSDHRVAKVRQRTDAKPAHH